MITHCAEWRMYASADELIFASANGLLPVRPEATAIIIAR